jgi:hypothetical protein
MKNKSPLLKQLLVLFCCIFLLTNTNKAQKNGILPLSGLRFFNEGISAEAINVKIDGAQLLSNRIPLNKEIEIELQQPAGFIFDNNKSFFAAAELLILSPRGEILAKAPNLLAANQTIGFGVANAKKFSIKFTVPNTITKGNLGGQLKIRLYDLKSKSQLRMEIPVSFARIGETVQVSRTTKPIRSTDGVKAISNGLQVNNKMIVNVDTTIKVSPKMAYTSLVIPDIEGSSIAGIFGGKENFWVYDSELNEIKISDILLKQVKGAMENNSVSYTLKIPYRLKTALAKLYTVRFRWESPDKTQVIDVVVNN